MKSKRFVLTSLAVWILLFLSAFHVTGEIRCSGDALKRINVSTELQSDVLLPCNFDPALLGSDRTADLSVVWSQINTTVQNLLEITLQGEEKFWDSKDRRIKPFAKLSESGNFSILLTKVQPSDLSLYRCELYNGTSCRTAYQEIQLSVRNQPTHGNLQSVWIMVGTLLTGVIVLLAVLTTCLLRAKRRQNIIIADIDYENVNVGTTPQSDSGSQSVNNPIYGTSYGEGLDPCTGEEGLSSDIPVYATVKKGKKVNKDYNEVL